MASAAGLGALGFWLFLAAIIVASIWFDAKKREAQQETLRRIVESGQQIDAAVVDKLLAAGGGQERKDRDLKIGGIITMSVGPGLYLFGYFMSRFEAKMLDLMTGVALLVFLVGAGIFIAGKLYEYWYRTDQA